MRAHACLQLPWTPQDALQPDKIVPTGQGGEFAADRTAWSWAPGKVGDDGALWNESQLDISEDPLVIEVHELSQYA